MSHMQKDITVKQRGWRVDVSGETWYVPGDVVEVPQSLHADVVNDITNGAIFFNALAEMLRPYVGPGQITGVEVVNGYFGRWSAPGYLDCTDWQFDKTLRGIREALSD